MKTMKLIYPLAFALAITLAATGCKHDPVNVTPMHQDRRHRSQRSTELRYC